MPSLKTIQAPIATELKKVNRVIRQALSSDVRMLNLILRYVMRSKGKQMRPTLVLLSAKMVGEVSEATYRAATLIELMHTATLIHDDVIDNADTRRGFLTLHKIWKSKLAVLIGDYLLSRGLLLAVNEDDFNTLRIVSTAVKEMSEGELLQIEKSKKLDITEKTYFDIIRKKTASLLASCSSAGARSAGADDDTVKQLWDFGEAVGIAFQIKDDILDYEGNHTGKKTGNDIREKKITLPLLYAFTQVEKNEKRKIFKLLRQKHKTQEIVDAVIEFVHQNGGIEYADKIMAQYTQKALRLLEPFKNASVYPQMVELVQFVTTRNK